MTVFGHFYSNQSFC